MGGGTIFKAIGKLELGRVPIIQPPSAVADGAEELFAENLKLIQALTSQEHCLVEIRDLLLPKLVTGQLDVSELDLDTAVGSVA